MKKKIVVLTDDLAKELESYPNQSDVIRTALQVYISNITPEMINSMRMTFKKIDTNLSAIERAVDKIAQAAGVTIDKHSDWGA